jgi:cytochrome c biogenesis protein CcmG/thiol:disulfide interchange protein DsbE
MGGRIVIAASLMVSLWAAQADEVLPILKVNGLSYTNVTITKVSATDIYFTNANGMANAKLKDLDRKTQKHFHYSASKAKAAERLQAADAAQYHDQLLHDYPQPVISQPSATSTNPPVSDEGKPIWANSFLNHLGPQLFVERWLTPMPDTRDKFILYDFWSTTSPACRAEIQELNAFQKEFSDRLVIVGISDESEETVRKIADPIVEYSLAIDTQARTKTEVGVTGLPHLMLMDPKGFVRWEGYPFLPGHEFSNKVLTDIIAQYDKETHDVEGTR